MDLTAWGADLDLGPGRFHLCRLGPDQTGISETPGPDQMSDDTLDWSPTPAFDVSQIEKILASRDTVVTGRDLGVKRCGC